MTNQQIINPADLIAWGDEFRRRAEFIEKATWEFIEFLGDGYRAFGDAIYDQVDKQHYSLGTLRNMVTTALNFPSSRRRELPQLSPAHYQVVNGIKDRELQEAMLRWAKENEATRDGLREECKRLGLLRDKTALELALDNHALAAENTIQARELAATKAEVAASNGRWHALEEQVAAIERAAAERLADNPNVGMTYPRGEDHSEWLTGRCECGGHLRLVCDKCGEIH